MNKPRYARCALALALACAALLCGLAFPAQAFADDPVAHSFDASNQRTDYVSISEAVSAGYNGATIVMDADWDLGDNSLRVEEGKSLTIDMCGHKITSCATTTILMISDSSLTLTSSSEAADIAYRGFARSAQGTISDQNWEWKDLSVTTSGLVTNTATDQSSGIGIRMGGSNKLTLENVAIAGCSSSGIRGSDASTINLTNAQVCHNSNKSNSGSTPGGGIYLSFSNSTINMNASHIDNNYSYGNGGGVVASNGTTINMENNSTISGNTAAHGGGGVYCMATFTLRSSDKTGTISGNASLQDGGSSPNESKSGGGIHVKSTKGDNGGLIEGITIKDNYSGYDGGGVELDQKSTKLSGCTITGNSARCDGGGIFVYNEGNIIDSCVIRNNYCNAKGGDYEGGGVFVSYHYDIQMSGTCVVKGNTRGENSGNPDDVFLGTVSGGSGKAYILGRLEKGSSVGVRTGVTGDRRVAQSFSCETKDGLFMDLSDSYYVSYGTDNGGDAWQRHATSGFVLTVNGRSSSCRSGAVAAACLPAELDGKRFWYWDAGQAAGLNPVGDYIMDANRYAPTLVFRMPQNDVSLTGVYADTVKGAAIEVDAPVAGIPLATTAKVVREDGGSGGQESAARVYWYEVTDSGKVPAAGNAKPGTTYVARLVAQQAPKSGVVFDGKIAENTVYVAFLWDKGGIQKSQALNAGLVEGSGELVVDSSEVRTSGSAPADTKTGTVKVKVEKKGVVEGGAKAAAAVAALSDDERESAGAAGGEDTLFEISYAYSNDSDQVTIAAPYLEGYNFLAWGGVGKGLVDDDDVVSISVSELAEIENTLTATYTPVVTGLTVDLDAPVAGEALAATCGGVKAACSGDEEFDFATVLGKEGGFAVIWSPEDPDDAGAAACSTAYTALIELDEVDDLENVEDVLADGATVTCNGVTATSAGFVAVDGKLYLAVAFPATADKIKATSVSQPSDIELTFEDAVACEAESEGHEGVNCWPLAKTVSVTLENGESIDVDIVWETLAGFDANATSAQVLSATGKLSLPDWVDAEGISLDVAAKVKIAAPAPAPASASASGQNPGTKGATSDGGASQAATKSKKGTPATGDTAGAAFPGLLALAVAALAGARAVRRCMS